jgi:hypothetical protein
MESFCKVRLGFIGALALAGTAYAQVPSTNDTSTTDGKDNTGMGTGALGGPNPMNLTGTDNTASGFEALHSNTTGDSHTASGSYALSSNSTGFSNTTGGYNTASGGYALLNNTTANSNTASGAEALESNTTGQQNTASGADALLTPGQR